MEKISNTRFAANLSITFEDGSISKTLEFNEFSVKWNFTLYTWEDYYEFSYFDYSIRGKREDKYKLFVSDDGIFMKESLRPNAHYYEGVIPVNFYRPGD